MPAPKLSDRDATFMVLYPEIFGPGPWHTEPSPICWGLTIGDGWMPLLHRLCEDLVVIIREDGLTEFRAIQVKEKFGTLRFYARGGNERTRARVAAAEQVSARVCEGCGAPVRLGDGGDWTRTMCEACRKR